MNLVKGAVDSRSGYVSEILYVKMKESGPVGGGARAGRAPLDPPMVKLHHSHQALALVLALMLTLQSE